MWDAMPGTHVEIVVVPVVFFFHVFTPFDFTVGPPKWGGEIVISWR